MAHPSADRARRHEIEAVFDAAIELAPVDRASWIAARCAGDHRLRVEVEALIAAHERMGGILEQDGAAAAAAVLPDMSRDRRIGSYRVLRELGRGGMGIVYLAERDDGQYRQRVAVKLLHANPDANELRHRFLAERQILASLRHPGIAQLLDGGIDRGELPYLVMEYVDGAPITTHCDRRMLGIEARLRLFLDVCGAVHHAHRNLIIHRDLKPGNVFVSGDGRVKLLDFGVAKLLASAPGPVDQPLTRAGARPMTPEYASPEQVLGEPLTTASDVYSLGVLLYELLTGRRPYYLTTDSPGELWEVVCSREAERPSAVVARPFPSVAGTALASATPGDAARARGFSPERLRRALRGDLDAIVMMALRKGAAERYGSADMLREDLQRYLDGLPVFARRGSRVYRARKFLARHRVESGAAAIVIVSLAVGVSAALRQASVAARERDVAEEARAEAALSLRQSERVTSFLVGLYDANAVAPGGSAVTARNMLRRGAAQVEALRRQPLEQARMLEAMGRVHVAMASYPEARESLERSLQLRVAQLGPDHPEVARTLFHLVDVLRRMGRYDEAEALSRRALAIRMATFGAQHPATAELLAQRASLFVYRSDLRAAEALSRRALDIRRRTLPPTDSLIALSLDQHASHLRRLGRDAEAEAELRAAIAVRRGTEGPGSADAAVLELRLGNVVLETRGDTAQAESLMRSALEIIRSALGDDHPRTAWAMSELAEFVSLRGKQREAEQLALSAVAIRRKAFGAQSVFVAEFDKVLANVYIRGGRWADAERIQREALSIQERMLGARHSAYAGTLGEWADALTGLARYDEAIAAKRRVIEIRRRALGNGNNLYGIDVARLAHVYARKGDYSIADSLYRVALASQARYVPTTHPDVRHIYRLMAERYRLDGKGHAAAAYDRLALPR